MSVMDIYNQAFDEYSQQVYGPKGIAYNSPNKLQYDIDANAAAARVPSAIAEGAFPGAIGQGLGFLSDLAMPALALGSSPFYDIYQATQRAKQANPVDKGSYAGIVDDMEVPAGPTMGQFVNAIRNENIIDSAIGRTLGAGQNLANRFSNIGTAFSNIGTAQASDLPGIPSNSLERDFPGMSTGDIIESMNNRPQNLGFTEPQDLGFIEEAPQVKEAIYQDRIRQQNLPGFASEPQYRIRDQLKRDFLEGGLFRDAKQSLGQTKDAFLEDVSGLRNMIGNAKKGIINSSPMNFLRGLPTPTNLLLNFAATRNPLNPRASNYNPTLKGQVDYMKDKGMYGITDQSGLNKITGGRLAGKNLVSLFGSNDLGEMYGKDLSKLEGYLESMPRRFSRLRKNNPGSYQNKIDNLNAKIAQNKIEAQAAQEARQASTAARARAANPGVYARADALGFTNPGGGFKSAGTNENFSNRTGRGRTGYSEGGLASMFTRRG